MAIAGWLRREQTSVAVFMRFRKASWFALNGAQNTADPKRSAHSDQKLNV